MLQLGLRVFLFLFIRRDILFLPTYIFFCALLDWINLSLPDAAPYQGTIHFWACPRHYHFLYWNYKALLDEELESQSSSTWNLQKNIFSVPISPFHKNINTAGGTNKMLFYWTCCYCNERKKLFVAWIRRKALAACSTRRKWQETGVV